MPAFLEDDDLKKLSAFGAQCAINPWQNFTSDEKYRQGFTQNYTNQGKLKDHCECTKPDTKSSQSVEWTCTELDGAVQIPPRNLMETKDVLYNLTNLRFRHSSGDKNIPNQWILGK